MLVPVRPAHTGRAPLRTLGTLRSGYVPSAADRGRPGQGTLRALQARDVAPDGSIAWAALSHVDPVRDGDRYVIREGDLLLPLRSARLQAVVARDVPPDVIAAGHWALLTPDPDRADAGYLAWYLNHPATRARLTALMSGGSLIFLPLSAIRDFEIELPPLDLQHRIAHTAALHGHIAELESQLAHARQQLVDTLTMDTLRRATTA